MIVRLRLRVVMLAATGALVTACAGTASVAPQSPEPATPSSVASSPAATASVQPTPPTTPTTPDPEAPYDQRLALRAVGEAFPDGKLMAIRTRTSDGVKAVTFTVRLTDGSSRRITLNWFTGEVLSTTTVKTPRLVRRSDPVVPALEALDAALARVSAAVFTSLRLAERKGELVWVIKVDSSTGPHTFRISAERPS